MKGPGRAACLTILSSERSRSGRDGSWFRPPPFFPVLALLFGLPSLLPGADLNWDGECSDPPPQNWHCTCSAPSVGTCNGGGTSNWDNDGIPGASDNATIAAGSGEVHIDNDVEVASVSAGDGIKLDFYNLRLMGSGSSTPETRPTPGRAP